VISGKLKKFKSGLIVLGIFLVCDLILAQGLKNFTDFWRATYPPMDHRIRSEKFHHTLAKNRVIQERWGAINYSFATNSLGFKDTTVRDVSIDIDKKRILFLGDSFTEGSGFIYQDTFVGKIAQEYKKQDIEILNGGVVSYAPEIYFRKTKFLINEIGLSFNHVVVLIDVSDIRDEVTEYLLDNSRNLIVPVRSEEKTINKIGHWFRDNSMSARLFTLARDNLAFFKKYVRRRHRTADHLNKSFGDVTEAEMTAFAVVPHFASEWAYNEKAWNAYGKQGRRKAAENMDRLADLLRSKNIGLTLAVYPWPDQILNDPKAPRHPGFWKKWAEEKKVWFIDLFPLFTKDKPFDVLGKYFLRGDMHWNAAGHAAVAQEFIRLLKIKN